MPQLSALKIKRGQQKAILTRTNKYIQNLNDELVEQEKTKFELEFRLQNLHVAYKVFNEIQDQIELSEEADGSDTESEREEFENSYFSLCAQLKGFIEKFKSLQHISNSKQSDKTEESVSEETSTEAKIDPKYQAIINPYIVPQVHLPLSKLPQYNGEYDKWVEFRDSFQALVDKNPIITNIQKLQYLKSCLGPTVIDTIQAIPMTAENYELAWDTLKSRYEKSNLIRMSHVKAILNVPRISRQYSKDLRKFLNDINNNLESLRNLGEPVDSWDLLLFPIIVEKLDTASQQEWERYSTLHNSTKIKDLFQVLNLRSDILEKLENNKVPSNKCRQGLHQLVQISEPIKTEACVLCNAAHKIFYCTKFLKLSPKERISQIKRLNRCLNCLGSHWVSQCKNASTCKHCGKKHNTLLHLEQKTLPSTDKSEVPTNNKNTTQSRISVTTAFCKAPNNNQAQILLSTALVLIKDKWGKEHVCRALLDNGAMSNFITSSLQKRLGLDGIPMECTVSGIGQSAHLSNSCVSLVIRSRINNYSKSIQCLVLDKITSNILSYHVTLKGIQLPISKQLADPKFNVSQPVELLLGSSIFWELLQPKRQKVANTNLVMQSTKLGWIVGGSMGYPQIDSTANSSINCLSVNDKLTDQIQKFWQINEVPEFNLVIDSKDPGEQIFQKTIRKSDDGKFVVTVPFKENYNNLGESKMLAKAKFFHLEEKLNKNPKLQEEYSKFMTEYLELNHMTLIEDSDNQEESNYYIPHHGVFRESSLTTKLRVVFNASMKTDSGLSLNDVQYPGPAIQNDLTILLINFRIHPYVMTADIAKMYRMIWLNPDQTKFHRIFWRNHPSETLKCYELKTVTYGTASAPFLAIRCLHELARENQVKYPEAAHVIKNNFYVDDLVCGSQSQEKLIQLQKEVTQILQEAGLELRKWRTNYHSFYNQFTFNKNLECAALIFGDKDTTKALGIAWDAKEDKIHFIPNYEKPYPTTKRKILSKLAQIFDPLGLLGPIIVNGKFIMQELWKEKLKWDDPVPQSINKKWSSFNSDIQLLKSIEIPRHVLLPNTKYVELHGFGDASQKAYGAAIYLVSKLGQTITSNLLCSRSRVAPLKQQSLPRLELCAAVLVAQLASKLINSLEIPVNKSYFWTDSTIVLSWLQACPTKWKTFVANRVAEIQRLTKTSDWYHIPSSENPADKLSRGCSVTELHSCNLWWKGPSFLEQDKYPLQHSFGPPSETFFEERPVVIAHVQSDSNIISEIITKFSTLNFLTRVVAYCLRFSNNCRLPTSIRKQGELEVEEIKKAMIILIANEQQLHLTDDYKILQENKSLKSNNQLSALNPFLHTDGLIRVGGRLDNSSYSFDKKHPIILPKNSKLTFLIFQHFHLKYFHCGPTQLLAAVRELYWPVSGKQLTKRIFQKCVICTKLQPKPFYYLMGNLPRTRAEPSIPFAHVGIDYAGPFQIKDRLTRNAKLLKGYICLFVCFVTKAVHLELVSDLTTSCFLDALKRFISRRGKPIRIYSDNAKTFLGASAEIKELHTFLDKNADTIKKFLTSDNINWSFIPPRAPHFGGIWEAGVKSVKFYLRRITKNHTFTFEQFYSILCQIEGILNSRPLCPLLSTHDLEPLTPGHFLILRPPMSTSPPTNETALLMDIKLNQHYKRNQQIIFQFWVRWRKEYLAELQRRGKWKVRGDPKQPTIKEGDIVILKDESTTPMKWPLAKVLQLHSGQDGVARVATVQFNNSAKKRPVTKLCPLIKE